MSDRYINKAQQRILALLALMAGKEAEGCAPGELAKSLDVNPAVMTSDLRNLLEAGYAEQMDTGRWRLTPRITRIAFSVLDSLKAAKARLSEVEQRFTRIN